jgi:ABC-type branched-subunit amino acid transport system ATPase component
MGKTTLVNCITGHLPVASGTMTWHDGGSPPYDLMPLSAQSRSAIGIGYVPQDKRIFSQLSGRICILPLRRAGTGVSGAGEIYDLFPSSTLCAKVKGLR